MANVTQDRLYEMFVQISSGQTINQGVMIDASEQLANSVSEAGRAILGTTATITQQTSGPQSDVASYPGGPAAGPLVSPLQDTPNRQTLDNGE